MLNYLDIRNFALIEHSEVEFGPGFNVITGESGAGKSILMGAIGLLLGGRADKGVIRTGTARCTVTGNFSVPPELRASLAPLLEEAGIPWEQGCDELNFRRVVTPSGVRNFLNDTPVGAKLLATVGEYLLDHHGAGEQLSLMHSARQLELLDRYASLGGARAECAKIVHALADLAAEKAEFERTLPDDSEASRLEAMLEEINQVNPEPGEDEKLNAQYKLGSNSRQVMETAQALEQLLTEGEDSIADRLGTVYHHLAELGRIDDTLTGTLLEEVNALQDGVAQLTRKIESLAEGVDLDPEALAAIENRLSAIYTLKRRYGPTLEQLFDAKAAAEERIRRFRETAGRRQEFLTREKALQKELRTAAEKLSAARKSAAGGFLKQVREKLKGVGFPQCTLEAEFTPIAPGASGMDHLELIFSANPGEAVRPLRKVASSGELSRLMLALKTVLADADATATVVFDEIDMNIGGETANKVGDELHHLGEKRQILCISHLAQVAARADRHYLVGKYTGDGRTFSCVRLLEDPVPELARMLGGGDGALRHAKDLMS